MGYPRAGGDRAVPPCLLGEPQCAGARGHHGHERTRELCSTLYVCEFLLLLLPCEKVVILHT